MELGVGRFMLTRCQVGCIVKPLMDSGASLPIFAATLVLMLVFFFFFFRLQPFGLSELDWLVKYFKKL